MFSGPMFRREYHVAWRKHGPFVFRTLAAVTLGLVALLSGLIASSANANRGPGGRTVAVGQVVLGATLSAELFLLATVIPLTVAGAIGEEREQDTLPWLLLTRLTPLEIVLTKAAARWVRTLGVMLVGLPLIVVA